MRILHRFGVRQLSSIETAGYNCYEGFIEAIAIYNR